MVGDGVALPIPVGRHLLCSWFLSESRETNSPAVRLVLRLLQHESRIKQTVLASLTAR
jgi:hypothetical protein